MRILSFNPNVQRNDPNQRATQAPRGGHLRIIESAAPANSTGQLLQFHRHREPAPAA